MRQLAAIIFAYFLTACSSIPGVQTAGLEPDPERQVKLLLVTAGLATDAVGVYGRLPPCELKVKPCKKEAAYRDAKLVTQALAADMGLLTSGKRSAVAMGLILMYGQWQISKTLSGEAAPTDPESPPTNATIAYLDALGAADLLVNSADERVRDAASVNSSVADLLADLQGRVAALP